MSKLTLVPPEPGSTPRRSLEGMNEEQMREYLNSVQSVRLDELRESLRTMRTSELLVWFTNPAVVAGTLGQDTDATEPQELQLLVAAAMLALSDEIDRRLPVVTHVDTHGKPVEP